MRKIITILTAITLFFWITSPIMAETLESDNYKIIDLNSNQGGEVTKSGTGNYNLLSTVGGFSGDPRLTSTNYRSSVGQIEIFTANVPKISCFETTSNGSSQCSTGPSYLNSDGMITICGPNGCYDRARFEIDTQKNPADTLYAIQISTDGFSSDIRYIDGITNKPKSATIRTINDYKTKISWETDAINIKGLVSSTQYEIRAVALHGDFTESEAGPIAQSTTASTYMTFDIDIAQTSGITDESSPPYEIGFSNTRKLVQTGPAQTAVDLIWMDIATNALGGFALIQKGENGGLYSTNESYLIPSDNFNLDGESEGFGLQNYYTAQERQTGSGNGDLGAITVSGNYSNSGNIVGKIDPLFLKVYESNKPLLNGRLALSLKARASGSTPVATDYSESVTLIMIPRY